MKITRYVLQVICITLCTTCAKEPEITPRAYSRIKTLSVSNITEEGALFEGEITFLGDTPAEHGFLWHIRDAVSPYTSEFVNLGPVTTTGKFSVNIQRSLGADVDYYMCSYLKSGDRYVLGNILTFKSLGSMAPRIESFQPSSGFVMDTVQIRGKNFSNRRDNVKVMFGDKVVSTLISASDTLLVALVPVTLTAELSAVSVTVADNISSSSEKFRLIPPEIVSVSKSSVAPADTLTISGNNFSNSIPIQVLLNEVPCKVITSTPHELKVIVPFFRPTSDEVPLKVISSNLPTIKNITYLKPVITSLETDEEINIGETVRLKGKNIISDVTVKFGSNKIIPLHLTSDYIDFVIPQSVTSGFNSLWVTFGQNSDLTDFTTDIAIAAPVLSSVTPTMATFNEEIIIAGRNFHPRPDKNLVSIAGATALVVSGTPTSLKIKVPVGIGNCAAENTCNTVSVEVLDYSVSESGLFTLQPPIIESVEPAEVTDGTSLTVHGKFFNPGNTPFNTAQIDEKSVSPVSATAEKLVFNLDEINTTSLITLKKETTVKVSNSNAYPISINLKGPYTKKGKFPATLGNNISKAIVGGNAYVGLGLNGSSGLSDFYKYNADDDTWAKLADFPGPVRRYPVSFSLGDFVYVGMGLVETSPGNSDPATDMWRYNTISGSWEQISDFPGVPKYNPFAFVLGDKAYIGGGSLEPLGSTLQFWTFDGSTWQQKNDLPEFNGSSQYFLQNSTTAYVFFGKKLFKYSTTADHWSYVSDFPSTAQVNSFTGGMIDGIGYLWSFLSGGGYRIAKYIASSNSWESWQVPFNLLNPESFIVNNKLYIIKGATFGSPSNVNVWEFDYTKYPF